MRKYLLPENGNFYKVNLHCHSNFSDGRKSPEEIKARYKELGYSACIVEGNPKNYNPRGFKTSQDFGIFAHESVGLPAPECLMVQELKEGALEHIKGGVEYSFYETLR